MIKSRLSAFVVHRRAFALGMASLIAASFLSLPANAQTAKPLTIVATTSMIADAVRQIGGGHVEVTALMGPGVDPHTYRQTRSDILAMSRADAVFWHGLYLEAQLEEFFASLASKRKVVALADTLPKELLRSHYQYPGRYDPHVWMDPKRWIHVVRAAEAELGKLAPDAKAEFAANAARHIAEIEALASYAERVLATVPKQARVLITAHDAFSYFGQAYDFEVLGIQGISTESEAGLKQVETLVDTIVARKIGAIFIESSVSDRNVRALVEGAAARGHKVVIGGQLFSDAMGPAGTYEGTYIGMIDHNVTVIARALGGQVPDGGMSGKLAKL
jgi:manganese/zinc/iron transport system substrate-binding protein